MNFREEETTLTGTIEHIIYHNEENGYGVFLLGGEDEVVCTGNFLVLEEGLYVSVTGHETEHPKYGFQFQVTYMEEKEPEDVLSIEKYLASGAIKGIGPKTANLIVRTFEEDTLRIMEEEPERLTVIKGISEKKARDIYAQIEETRGMRNAMMFLQKFSISNRLAVKIYDRYGSGLFRIIKENPYRLSEDIDGLSFKKADDIAMSMGLDPSSEQRLEYCILDILKKASYEGHMFLPLNVLRSRSLMMIGFEIPNLYDILTNMAVDGKVVLRDNKISDGKAVLRDNKISDGKAALCDNKIGDGKTVLCDNKTCEGADDTYTAVYYAPFYYLETETARMLMDLNGSCDINDAVLSAGIREFEKKRMIDLDPLQKQGVIEAARNNIFILTGGPGTGKTTMIQAIINMFELEGMDITLCAPTGRAARRMTQATGYPARTIHRLLEVRSIERDEGHSYSGVKFNVNEDNPLETDVIIVDEMSMVDISLLNSLLKAVIPGTHLIFIGDTSQLPSVGPGLVLKDMIDSGVFRSICLTSIFRQDEDSDIVINAHKIDKGQVPSFDNKSKDFFFISQTRPISIRENIKKLIGEKLPSFTGAEPFDIQVLSPTRKGPLGVRELNPILQNYLNPPSNAKREHDAGHYVFREGDKVIQIRNNYDMNWEIKGKNSIVVEEGTGIFNGDMGIVTEINDYFEEVTVLFEDNREVKYPFDGLEDLELAYALTVHKSQGSEYPVVIIPILSVPPMLRTRNLLYTGVTRAKTHVILMGTREIIEEMILNEKEQKRYTTLKTHIQECERLYREADRTDIS